MGSAGTFLNYARPDLPADETLSLTLEGRPSQGATAASGERDLTSELLVGGGVLLLVAAAGFYFLRAWQQGQAARAPVPVSAPLPAAEPPPPTADEGRREELLVAIAALDDAYEAGQLEESEYEAQRRELKDELLALWQAS